jgi:hypothetical protein
VTLPRHRPRLIYFDSSVLDAVAIEGAGGRVKALMKKHQSAGFASVQVLLEAYRISDPTIRGRMMRTILQVARQR